MTTEEKLENIKNLADAMYYAAANLGPTVGSGEKLRKTMEEYHKFIIHEYHKEEPVSEDLNSFAIKYAQDKPYPVTVCQAVKVGANWQKQHSKCPCDCPAFKDGIKVGREEMKQQMDEYLKDMSNEIDLIGD